MPQKAKSRLPPSRSRPISAPSRGLDPDRHVDGSRENQSGIDPADLLFNLRQNLRGYLIAAGQDRRVGPPQTRDRLSQQSGGEHLAIAKRLRRVDGDNVQVPGQPAMLKTIVHDQGLGIVAADRLRRPGHAVRVDDHRRIRAQRRQQGGLIGQFALLHLVAPRQDRAADVPVPQQPAQPDHQRRLARAAGREVADAEDRDADPAGLSADRSSTSDCAGG